MKSYFSRENMCLESIFRSCFLSSSGLLFVKHLFVRKIAMDLSVCPCRQRIKPAAEMIVHSNRGVDTRDDPMLKEQGTSVTTLAHKS